MNTQTVSVVFSENLLLRVSLQIAREEGSSFSSTMGYLRPDTEIEFTE